MVSGDYWTGLAPNVYMLYDLVSESFLIFGSWDLCGQNTMLGKPWLKNKEINQ